MPFGDRTGPAGMGPMTGRAAGFCAGYGMPGNMNPGYGRGFAYGRGRGRGGGFGRGGGRGFGRGAGWWGAPGWGAYPNAAPANFTQPAEELDMLKEQAEYFRGELDAIGKRIGELEKEES